MLGFHLLGPFEAWRNDEPIPQSDWRTRQTLAVLKLLLEHPDRLVPFDRLADVVWPDSEGDAARASLRGAVRTIRRVLEPELPTGGASRYLRTEPQGYRFVSTGCFLDVDGFARACQAGKAAERRGDSPVALRAYREAVALYRGDYLADDPYADWALDRRERLRGTYLDALDRLASLQAAGGAYGEAIGYLERALTVDPLREELYCQLMRCHAAAGRRSHALATYDRCRKILEAELGVPPAAETQRLRGQITKTPAATDQATDELAGSLASSELELAFVGREPELAAIERAWARAQTEPGHVVLVRGKAGVGKTRLAQQFAERGGPQLRAVWLTAHEAEQELPFAPLISALANFLSRSASAAQLHRLGAYSPVLAHLVPQVRVLWPDCPPLPPSGAEPSQLLEALTQALLLIKGAERALLVFDDLHWADQSTRTWLSYALQRFDAGMLVLATSRTEDPAAEAQATLVAALRRADRLTELELSPLSVSDVQRMVSPIQPTLVQAAPLARRLHEATQGNPLFLIETLRELQRQGQLHGAGGAGWSVRRDSLAGEGAELPLPASVREAIQARVRRLDTGTREALTAVCVLGVPCRARLVAAMLERGSEATLAELEILLQRELLRTTDDGQDYTTEHPLVRRVVYDDLSPGRRQDWHRRAARALERSHADHPTAVAAQVLRHLLAGDASHEDVLRVGRIAADHALSQHAYAEALDCYQTVRQRLVGRLPEADAGAGLDAVIERQGEALTGAGRWEEAVACYEHLLGGKRSPLDRSRLRRKLAQVLADSGALGLDRALDLLDAAERDLLRLDQGDPEVRIERGRVDGTRTLAHLHRSDFQAGVESGIRALHLLEGQPGVERDLMEQINRIAVAEQRLGRLAEAEARFRELLPRARAMGHRLFEARFQDSLAILLLQRGELKEALELQEQALRTYREFAVRKVEAIGVGNRAYLLDHLGDLRGARAAYEEALELAAAIKARHTIVHNRVGLGEVLVRLGEYPLARSTLESAVALAQEIGTHQRLAHAYLHLADLALHEGDPQAARELAEQGIRQGNAIGDGYSLRRGNPILARALLRLGDAPGAAAAAQRGLEAASPAGFVLDEGRNLLALGEALWARGTRKEAATAQKRAEEIFRRAGARYLLAEALWSRAMTSLGARPATAAAALEEALSLARAAGARPLGAWIAEAQRGVAVAGSARR